MAYDIRVRESLLFRHFSAISRQEQINFQWDDDQVRFVVDQHVMLVWHSANSLKQQFADSHVAPLGHIILIPGHPYWWVFPSIWQWNRHLTVYWCTQLKPTAGLLQLLVIGLLMAHLKLLLNFATMYSPPHTTASLPWSPSKWSSAQVYWRRTVQSCHQDDTCSCLCSRRRSWRSLWKYDRQH